MAQLVRSLALSLLGMRSVPGPGISTCHGHGQKKKKKKKKKKKTKERENRDTKGPQRKFKFDYYKITLR